MHNLSNICLSPGNVVEQMQIDSQSVAEWIQF